MKVTLCELGLQIQLGHPLGDTCANPELCSGDNFTILNTQSIQSVSLDFCTCGASHQSKTSQLFRSQFYPATVANPQTAATFHALEMFKLLSYISKVSVFGYYQALSRLSDNSGLNVPNVSLSIFVYLSCVVVMIQPQDWYKAFLR